MKSSGVLRYLLVFAYLASFSGAYPSLSVASVGRDFQPTVHLNLVDDCGERIVDVQPLMAYVFVDDVVYGNSTLMFEADRFLDVNVSEGANISIQVFSKSRFWSNRVSVPSRGLFPRPRVGEVSPISFVLSYKSEEGCSFLSTSSSTSTTMPPPVPEESGRLPLAFLTALIVLAAAAYLASGKLKGGSGKKAGGLGGAGE